MTALFPPEPSHPIRGQTPCPRCLRLSTAWSSSCCSQRRTTPAHDVHSDNAVGRTHPAAALALSGRTGSTCSSRDHGPGRDFDRIHRPGNRRRVRSSLRGAETVGRHSITGVGNHRGQIDGRGDGGVPAGNSVRWDRPRPWVAAPRGGSGSAGSSSRWAPRPSRRWACCWRTLRAEIVLAIANLLWFVFAGLGRADRRYGRGARGRDLGRLADPVRVP